MNKHLTWALALAAVGLASTAASAQNVSTTPNDLILGFEITDSTDSGQGATTNLEIDLGNISGYTQATSYSNIAGLVSADLTATYGSGWATRTDLAWGVAGANSATAGLTDAFDLTSSVAGPRDPASTAAPFNAVSSLASGLGSNAHTANSTSAADVPSTQGNSFQSAQTSGGTSTTDFSFLSPQYVTDISGGSSGPLGSLELYGFVNGSGRTPPLATDLGTFSLSSSGVLSYNGLDAVAVPEPSTYALGVCAALLFLALRRRRSAA